MAQSVTLSVIFEQRLDVLESESQCGVPCIIIMIIGCFVVAFNVTFCTVRKYHNKAAINVMAEKKDKYDVISVR